MYRATYRMYTQVDRLLLGSLVLVSLLSAAGGARLAHVRWPAGAS